VFFFNDTATTEIYTLSLHDALPISLPLTSASFHLPSVFSRLSQQPLLQGEIGRAHVELQSPVHLVCRLLLEKKKRRWSSPFPDAMNFPLPLESVTLQAA